MINNVTLVGRLTRDPDLRFTGNGTAVTTITIATDRPYKNAQGNRDTDFINCVAWRGTAETLANFAKKGSLVGVTGRIQTRNYENNEGRTVYITEVVIENFQMLEPKSVTDNRRGGNQGGSGYNNGGYNGNNQLFNTQNSNPFNNQSQSNPFENNSNNSFGGGPFSQNSDNNDPYESNDNHVDISDDDLPF